MVSDKTIDPNEHRPIVHNWFMDAELRVGDRLPAERVLAQNLGLSRAALRKGLAPLEADGLLVRQVGRGTFVRRERPHGEGTRLDRVAEPLGWPDCSPHQLISARLAFEPNLAALAAREATASQLDMLRRAAAMVAEAQSWSAFDLADDAFHRTIAASCGNPVLLHLFDRLAEARGTMHWGRMRERPEEGFMPPMAVIEEHARILSAITHRDAHSAEDALSHHLMVEATTMLGSLP